MLRPHRTIRNREGCDRVTVAELIEYLKTLPQDYTLKGLDTDDCGESYYMATFERSWVEIFHDRKEVWL